MDLRTVTTAYCVKYPNAIRVVSGTKVQIRKEEEKPEWLGWVWCEAADGQSGWISKDYLGEKDGSTVLTRDYDAKEVSVEEGEVVKVIRVDFGWAWVEKQNGDEGWIPLENL